MITKLLRFPAGLVFLAMPAFVLTSCDTNDGPAAQSEAAPDAPEAESGTTGDGGASTGPEPSPAPDLPSAGSETVFGLALPAGATDITRSDQGIEDGVQSTLVSFAAAQDDPRILHAYFARELTRKGWDITQDTFVSINHSGYLNASLGAAEIVVRSSTNARDQSVRVDLVRKAPAKG